MPKCDTSDGIILYVYHLLALIIVICCLTEGFSLLGALSMGEKSPPSKFKIKFVISNTCQLKKKKKKIV